MALKLYAYKKLQISQYYPFFCKFKAILVIAIKLTEKGCVPRYTVWLKIK